MLCISCSGMKIFKVLSNKNVVSIIWISLVLQIKTDHEVMKVLFRYISVHVDSIPCITDEHEMKAHIALKSSVILHDRNEFHHV